MKDWEVTLKDERARLFWKNGKIFAQGYDLESEKMAMILGGHLGEGIGALLVSIDAGIEKETDLSELENFEENLLIFANAAQEWGSRGPHAFVEKADYLVSMYCAYSFDQTVRSAALRFGTFTEKGLNHLAREQMDNIVFNLVMREDLTPKIFAIILSHPDKLARTFLAHNATLPPIVINTLCNDKSQTVRSAIARHKLCAKEDLEKLVFDDSEMVQAAACARGDLGKSTQERILKEGSYLQKRYLAMHSQDLSILRKLQACGDERIEKALEFNAKRYNVEPQGKLGPEV